MNGFVYSKHAVFQVGFLLVDGFSMLTYASAAEPLRAANEIAKKPLYKIWNIPAQGARATASCGTLVPANAHVGERSGFDLVVVVASNDSPDAQQPRLLDWLRQLDRQNIVLGGLAAGPLMLANAGLLRNRKMTLHWAFQNTIEELHPDLMVQQQLYVIDKNRLTCAGGTAPVDLMLAVITEHHGARFARQVSDWWSHPDIRPQEAPQRSEHASRYGIYNARVLSVIKLMESHLSDPLDLSQLASASDISERHINRLFKTHTAFKPMDFYKRLRLQKAYELLSQSAMSVSDIVAATGYSSHSHFSRSFKHVFELSPSEVRASLGKRGGDGSYASVALLP